MGFVIFKEKRLKRAEENFFKGKRIAAVSLAQALLKAKNKDIAYRANRICGLALYKQKKYSESLPCLKAACRLGNYQHDWFNYAVVLAYNGDAEQADSAFQNIYRTQVEPGYVHTIPLPIMLFQYLKALKQKGFEENARTRANELKQMYTSVGILNGQNERRRGLPVYHRFREEIASLFQAEELTEWEKEYLKF